MGAGPHSTFDDFWRFVYFATIVFCVSVIALSFYMYRTEKWMDIQTGAVIVIILIVLLLNLFIYHQGVGGPESVLPVPETNGGGTFFSGGGRVSEVVLENKGTLILTILSSTIVGILVFTNLKSYFTSDKTEELEKDFEVDMSSTVEEAIRGLYKGKDVNSTIIRCYQNMCYILEESGVSNDAFITPRELQKKTVSELNVSEGAISDLTKLFEKGRYSIHAMDEDDRKRAIKDLKRLKKEIEDKENR